MRSHAPLGATRTDDDDDDVTENLKGLIINNKEVLAVFIQHILFHFETVQLENLMLGI